MQSRLTIKKSGLERGVGFLSSQPPPGSFLSWGRFLVSLSRAIYIFVSYRPLQSVGLSVRQPTHPEQQTLVGRSMLYCWPSVGWCVGFIKEANGDRRFKMEGEVVNFFVHYEIDDNTSRHVLKLDTYGGNSVDSWVLLEALA